MIEKKLLVAHRESNPSGREVPPVPCICVDKTPILTNQSRNQKIHPLNYKRK